MPVILGEINGIMVKNKFNTLMILIASVESSSIILGKHTKNCERNIQSRSVVAQKEETLTLIIPVKYK